MKAVEVQEDSLDRAHLRVALGEGDFSSREVVEMLLRLGESLCVYGGGPWRSRRCDCKFLGMEGKRSGEASGCAEVRTAIELIERQSGSGQAQSLVALRKKVRKLRSLAREHLQAVEAEARL